MASTLQGCPNNFSVPILTPACRRHYHERSLKSHDPNENFLDGVSVKNNIIDALKLLRSGMMGDAYTINVVTKTSDSRFQI